MDWEIKKIDNKNDFYDLEKFYRKKFSSIYHNKLSADYLYWKLKKNKSFNGEMLVAKYENSIIGSISLTFKKAIHMDQEVEVAEIGDSYVDLTVQKNLIKKNINKKFKKFHEKSIFGSLVNEILNRSKFKNLDLIYGIPNNKSFQGYTKYLNFKVVNKVEINNFVMPSIKNNNIFFKYLNYFLKFYRNIISILFFKNFEIVEMNDISDEQINQLQLNKKKFDLHKTKKYFIEKYKFNPENNFLFLNVYYKKKLADIFVIKKDHKKKKILIVDNLSDRNFINQIVLKLNVNYDYSVSFWANNGDFKFFKKFIFTIFKSHKINVIYFNQEKIVQEIFFDNLSLGYSDNF